MASAGVRDWAALMPELLISISERLQLIDSLRFGAVCNSWAAAGAVAAVSPVNLSRPPAMPYLLHVGIDGESCTLVSLHDRIHHHIAPLPEIRDKLIVGSQDGWLALVDLQSEVSLFNPLTRAHIQLPSVTTIPGVDPLYNPDGSHKAFINHNDSGKLYTPAEYRNLTFKKIVMSSTPTAAGNYTVMAIFNSYCHSAVATTAGGNKWTDLEKWPFTDIIYRDGNFMLVSENGDIWVVDATTPPPEMRILAAGANHVDSPIYDKFLVDSSGDLLQVWSRLCNFTNTATFIVMKFNLEQGTWAPLKSLGDRSLFLGTCYSISLSAREIFELKPNSIYFTEILWDIISDRRSEERTTTRFVGIFNMEDGSIDHYCPSDPRLNWPPPLYFTPSLL